jgi:aryl-alcohol dehydrogenase-like predicted oxidoreductase
LLTKALWVSDVHKLARYDSLQPHYSLFNRAEFERELAPLCRDQGIGVIPYSPLAAGFLTGKYTRDNHQPDSTRSDGGLVQRLLSDEKAFVALDEVRRIASEHSVPVAHVALGWQLAQDVITSPIIGARTIAQLDELIGAVELKLSADEVAALNAVTEGY